ncbi:MAG: spermidine/putrescine transport system permease protein [Actinomycetota bacterium]|jgi:spermidine/putrescine transport system permease protein|nr:spermidine/putrescine transport system permease protein [Actinomycetota bacterium]
MSATVTNPVVVATPEEPPRRGHGRKWTSYILPAFTAAVVLYLIIPIVVMILFAFNNPPGRINVRWVGFSTEAFTNIFANQQLISAIKLSLGVAVISSAISTIIGSLLGLALGRYRFRGSGAVNYLVFLAIASPEIVLGTSLLTMFATVFKFIPIGATTIVISHVMFSISFVAVTVRARVLGLNPQLEEAGQDLFANPLTTFRKITFPLLLPALLAGFLLSFALSVDDFVITYFVSGSVTTFPLLINGSAKTGLGPDFNVIGTFLFTGGVLIAVIGSLIPIYTAKRDAKRLAQDKAIAERAKASDAASAQPA